VSVLRGVLHVYERLASCVSFEWFENTQGIGSDFVAFIWLEVWGLDMALCSKEGHSLLC